MAWAGGRAHKPLQRERRRDIHAGAHGPTSGGRSNRRAHEWSVLWCPEPSPAERVDLWPPQRALSHRARHKLRRLRDPTDDPRSDAPDGGSRRGQGSGTRSRDRSAVDGTGGLAEEVVGAPCRRRPLNRIGKTRGHVDHGDILGDIPRLNSADGCKAAPMVDHIGAAVATTYRVTQNGAEGSTYFRDRCLQPLDHPSKYYGARNLGGSLPTPQAL